MDLITQKLRNLRLQLKEHTPHKRNRPTQPPHISRNLSNLTAEVITLITDDAANTRKISTDCSLLITELFSAHHPLAPSLSAADQQRLVKWLHAAIAAFSFNEYAVLQAINSLVRVYPSFAPEFWQESNSLQYANIMEHLAAAAQAQHVVLTSEQCELLIVTLQNTDLLLESVVSSTQQEHCSRLIQALLSLHYHTPPVMAFDSPYYPQFLLSSLLFLNKCGSVYGCCLPEHVAELLGLAKTFMFYGIDSEAPQHLPQKAQPAAQMLYDSAEEVEAMEQNSNVRHCGGKVSKSRKPRGTKTKARSQSADNHAQQKRRFPADEAAFSLAVDLKTSDSDTSDRESGPDSHTAQRHLCTRVRFAAVLLVGTVVRTLERRVLYSYWHALFPNSSATERRDDLLQVCQRDPNARCRCTALQIVAQLLLGAKGFLSQAEYQVKTRAAAFMPFAQCLGLGVLATYEALTAIIANESSLPVLTQALKCLAQLVQATPFQRFECEFAAAFIQHVRKLTLHRDCSIQVSALMVMEFLVSAPELASEIATAIGLPKGCLTAASKEANKTHDDLNSVLELGILEHLVDSDEEELIKEDPPSAQKTTTFEPSWLLSRVLYNLDGMMPAAVRIESLQVLAAMATHFKLLLLPHLEHISKALQGSLNDQQSDVRLYAARTLDTCAYQLARSLLDQLQSISKPELDLCIEYWAQLLPIVMARIHGGTQEETPALKAHLCDALSNIGVVIFERLPQGSQLNLLSFLTGISSEELEEITVRAAAARALAVFVLFPSLRDNLVFIENTAEMTLRLVRDPNLVVRVKALWSLGNVSDALLGNSAHERISDELLIRLIEAASEACSDLDKVRCNAVRTLGNLLRLLNAQHFSSSANRALFQRSLSKLIECIRSAGNAKVKWNACYAIGNVMCNKELFEATSQYEDLKWQASLYPSMCHLIIHHNNFKVRINATAALQRIDQRSHYGSYFEQFWHALLEAIERTYNLQNYYEYNHRDQLQEQLCLGISHLLSKAGTEDFVMLKRELIERLEVVQNTWRRVINRMLPEKSTALQTCSVRLGERFKWHSAEGMKAEQRNAMNFIMQTLAMEQ